MTPTRIGRVSERLGRISVETACGGHLARKPTVGSGLELHVLRMHRVDGRSQMMHRS